MRESTIGITSEESGERRSMNSQMIEERTGISRLRGHHHEPVGPNPCHHGQSTGGFEYRGFHLTESGGLAQGRGLPNEGRRESCRRIRVDRKSAGGVNRQAVRARQHHRGDVGTVAERPYDLPQIAQTTTSAVGAEKVSAT